MYVVTETSHWQVFAGLSFLVEVVNDTKFSSLFHLIGQIYTNLDNLAPVHSIKIETFSHELFVTVALLKHFFPSLLTTEPTMSKASDSSCQQDSTFYINSNNNPL